MNVQCPGEIETESRHHLGDADGSRTADPNAAVDEGRHVVRFATSCSSTDMSV
jgi:hypothetical protein